MAAYALKAAREAKRHTSWHRPDHAYETGLDAWVEAIFGDQALLDDVGAFVTQIADAGYRNSLAQVLLKALAPGVPDVYQGTELWDLSLVDPDNRRPVDFALRERLLASPESRSAEELWAERQSGAVKLQVLHLLLQLRVRQLDALGRDGPYRPLSPSGPAAERVIAFVRGEAVVGVVTRWWQRHGPLEAVDLALPVGRWSNVLTGSGPWSGTVAVADLIGALPVAALERVS
jgi:(1->4)-alpha-D-glucan 1-alpha-D-glucosylmutase